MHLEGLAHNTIPEAEQCRKMEFIFSVWEAEMSSINVLTSVTDLLTASPCHKSEGGEGETEQRGSHCGFKTNPLPWSSVNVLVKMEP